MCAGEGGDPQQLSLSKNESLPPHPLVVPFLDSDPLDGRLLVVKVTADLVLDVFAPGEVLGSQPLRFHEHPTLINPRILAIHV